MLLDPDPHSQIRIRIRIQNSQNESSSCGSGSTTLPISVCLERLIGRGLDVLCCYLIWLLPSPPVTAPSLPLCYPFFSQCHRQCCGSGSGSTGSTCFWPSWIRIYQSEVWIRIRIWILRSPSKTSKKNLDSYYFVTSF